MCRTDGFETGAAYLSVFHPVIIDFLDVKKISADEDVRVKTLSIGVVVPDKFIELVREDKDFLYVLSSFSLQRIWPISR
ncbi:hypothetical protein FOS00_11490 [Bacillus atrophaeus]|nr:hypothetical protein [Bacillus atrophaeus]